MICDVKFNNELNELKRRICCLFNKRGSLTLIKKQPDNLEL